MCASVDGVSAQKGHTHFGVPANDALLTEGELGVLEEILRLITKPFAEDNSSR
jgi:hypothetical protein